MPSLLTTQNDPQYPKCPVHNLPPIYGSDFHGLFLYCPRCGPVDHARSKTMEGAEADWSNYVANYRRVSADLQDLMGYKATEPDMANPGFSIEVNEQPAPKIGRTDDTPKVTALRKGPNAGVIEALEAALEKARNGDLSSVFIAGVDGSRDGWRASHVEQRDFFILVGVMRVAERRLIEDAEYSSDEE